MKIQLGNKPLIELDSLTVPEIIVLNHLCGTEYYIFNVASDGCYIYKSIGSWIQINDIPRYRDLRINGTDSTDTDETYTDEQVERYSKFELRSAEEIFKGLKRLEGLLKEYQSKPSPRMEDPNQLDFRPTGEPL